MAPWGVNQSLFSVLSSERPQTLLLGLGGSLPSEGSRQSQQWAPTVRGIGRPCQLVRGPRRLWYHPDQGSKPRWTSPWPCHLRQATPTNWWGFCGEQMKLQETRRTAWGGWVSALPQTCGEDALMPSLAPGAPIWPHHWARPSVFPVWARLDSLAVPMPSRDLVSASFLLPAGRRGMRKGNPGTAGQAPPRASVSPFLKRGSWDPNRPSQRTGFHDLKSYTSAAPVYPTAGVGRILQPKSYEGPLLLPLSLLFLQLFLTPVT